MPCSMVAMVLPEAVMPTAELDLATGEHALAAARLMRRLNQVGRDGLLGAPLLARLVEVQIAAGDPRESRSATADELSAAAHDSGHPMAMSFARQVVSAPLGRAWRVPHSRPLLERAIDRFGKLDMPSEAGRTLLELAEKPLATTQPVPSPSTRPAARRDGVRRDGCQRLRRPSRGVD